jgi:hypothetical protein
MANGMSIAIQVHDKDPSALAELIVTTMRPGDGVVLDREAPVAHLTALVDAEEREGTLRRAAWHWLNSISKPLDCDNDWSDV